MQQFRQQFTDTTPLLIDYGINILSATVILILGWAAAKYFAAKVEKKSRKTGKIDATIIPLLSKLTRFTVLIITILAVLHQFGVQTASVIALIGAAGLAIGLALQGTLTNIASGIVILVLRPFKVGDAVDIGGTMGVVDEIGLFVTEMHAFDNIAITIPNSRVWGNIIKNYSRNDTRRIDLVFGIGYEDDMDRAIAIIKEVFDADERLLDDPEPVIKVNELADSSVNIIARPWVQSSDFFTTKLDLTKRVKERLDEEGLNIPFPQRDIYVHKVD